MLGELERLYLKGFFEVKAYRKKGQVKELVEVFRCNNHIVNGAFTQVAHLIGGNVAGRSVDRIAFGTNGVAPDDEDVAITDQFAKPVTGYEIPEVGLVQINWELDITECNGMGIMEFGLLTADDTLFARITRSKPFNKESDISLEGSWTIALSEKAAALFEEGMGG